MNNKSQNRGRKFWLVAWTFLFFAGLAGWLVLLLASGDTARVWRALLINFLYFTPLAAAMVTWSAIVVCSNGRWPGGSEALSWSGFGFLIPSILVLIALWIGSPEWAPWYGRTGLRQGAWLNNVFVFTRDIAALAVFWICAFWYLSRRRTGRRTAWTAGGWFIVAYCAIFSLFGFDLVMALNLHWHSMAFGAYFFISSLYGGILLWGLMVVFEPRYGPELRHDFGKLILAFSILATYFLFVQLLPIWYENLPDETPYLVHRVNYFGWNVVSSLIIGIVYLGPLVLLLTKRVKRNRYSLGTVSLLLLAGLWFERWWMVAPSFTREPVIGWAEFAATAGMLGAFGIGLQIVRKYLPPVPVEEEHRS